MKYRLPYLNKKIQFDFQWTESQLDGYCWKTLSVINAYNQTRYSRTTLLSGTVDELNLSSSERRKFPESTKVVWEKAWI